MSAYEDAPLEYQAQQQLESTTSSQVSKILDDLSAYVIQNAAKVTNQISMHELECKFNESSDVIRDKICDLFGESLSKINEADIIRYYKSLYLAKGVHLRTHRKYTRCLITSSGEILYSRNVLRPKTKHDADLLLSSDNKQTIIPLDEWLNIVNLPFKITPTAMVDIAWFAAYQLSYESAAIMIYKALKINISQETIRLVTDFIGNLVYLNDLNNANLVFNRLNSCQLDLYNLIYDFVLYLMVDGSMIHTRESDESGHKWRENKLGVIFSSDNMVLRSKDPKKFNYKILKKEYVDYFGSVENFQKMFFASAIRNGYGKYKKTVLISDGAKWISGMKDLLFPDAIHILDFWHLSEHVYDFAKIYFRKNELKYKPWAEQIKEYLLGSDYQYVLNEVIKMESKLKNSAYKGISTEEKNKIGSLSKYISVHEKNIDYRSYRSQGLYIGSGHIESGNKSVAQERLKRPGMMWKVAKAQNLLSLRAKLKSNLWTSDVKDVVLRYFNQV